MSSEWTLFQLDDLADEITVGFVGTMADQYVETGIPFLRSLNINPFEINKSDLKFISSDFHARLKKSSLRPGDVAIVRTGKPGTCAVIPYSLKEANCSDLVLVRCGNKLRPDFLCFWVNAAAQNHISANLVGAVQQHFNVGAAKKMMVPCPSLEEQDRVIELIGGINDRVTLLRETNTTLEAIAQALFKSWFVDFDPVHAKQQGRAPESMDAQTAALFPDSFEESELGMVPKGWKATQVYETAEIVKGKSYSSKDLAVTHDTALVTLKSFERGGGFRMDGFKPYTGTYKQSQVVVPGDLIIAYTDVTQAAELIGKPAIVVGVKEYSTLVASLDVGIVRPDEKICGKQFLYGLFRTEKFQSHTLAHTSGTTVLHLAKDGVGSFNFVLPSSAVVKEFEKIADAISQRRQVNIDLMQSLASTRDTLLPRLISGQLRLPEAQALSQEAMTPKTISASAL